VTKTARHLLPVFLSLLVASLAASRVDVKAEPPTAEQQARLKERDKLLQDVDSLRRAGKLDEAIAAAQQVLAIERQVFGPVHEKVAQSQDLLAALQEQKEDFAAARQTRKDVLALCEKLYGHDHWRVTGARLALAYTERLAGMDSDQRPRLAEAWRQLQRAASLRQERKFQDAEGCARKGAEVCKELLGEEDPGYAIALNELGLVSQAKGEYERAESLFRQASAVWEKALGEGNPTYLTNRGLIREAQGAFAEAEALYRQACAIWKKVRGEALPGYAATQESLAGLLGKRAAQQEVAEDFTAARQTRREVLAIKTKLRGEKHWQVTDARLALARTERLAQLDRKQRQDLTEADERLQKVVPAALVKKDGLQEAIRVLEPALELHRRLLGDTDPGYTENLIVLGGAYWLTGDHARGTLLLRQGLELTRQVFGEEHPQYAAGLTILGGVLVMTGDYPQAEVFLRRATEVFKRALGDKGLEYVTSLQILGSLYQWQGQFERAKDLWRQALDASRQDQNSPDDVPRLKQLASLYLATGDRDRAERACRQALELQEQRGKENFLYAMTLFDLAGLYEGQGDCERAAPLYAEAGEILAKVLGREHVVLAAVLLARSRLDLCRGDPVRAEQRLREALPLMRRYVELAAETQSERQQLALIQDSRVLLDRHLTLAPLVKLPGEQIYPEVLAWKGAVFARQQQARELRRRLSDKDQPKEARELAAELDKTTRGLAALAFAPPGSEKQECWRRKVEDATRKKEQLESKLARLSADFRRQQERRKVTAAEVRAALPRATVLIDFLAYDHYRPSPKDKGKEDCERRLAAFVVCPDRDAVEQLDLGPIGPIRKAVDRWRAALKNPGQQREAAAELRRLLWQPLEPHLKDRTTLLVSPDDALSRFPLAALPGSRSDTFLIEERAVAVVPVPQLLPELLAPLPRAGEPEPSLLLVGDVDFDADPGPAGAGEPDRGAPPGSGTRALPQFAPLDATLGEILVVQKYFQRRYGKARVLTLDRGGATTAAVREQAPRFRYLHLATHGFFAPPELRSALAPDPLRSGAGAGLAPDLFGQGGISGFHPGLLSGLAFAGANRLPRPGQGDGILTALEVAELDLGGVELAVLSACETGRGKAAGGEGVLGLQRAFQVAGARAVVASLCQVPDEPTRALLEHFYENLWLKKLGKVEALRQAQLWMLREGRSRSFVREDQEAQPPKDARLPPYYWAGFVLSGDWR